MELAERDRASCGTADELDPEPIEEAVARLDRGDVRVAERGETAWVVNEWAKKAILLYFRLRKVEPMEVGGLHFLDKIPVKADYAERGVRVVPPGVARYGSFLSEGVVLMPGFVNIGAWVGPRTMVDTWATVGLVRADRRRRPPRGRGRNRRRARASAGSPGHRRGRRVHRLARVVVEGSRRRRGRGDRPERRARRVDPGDRRHGPEPVEHRGYVPPRSVVLPGTRPKDYPAGRYDLPCALIVGAAERVDGSEDVAQRRSPRVRDRDVSDAVAEVALFTDDVGRQRRFYRALLGAHAGRRVARRSDLRRWGREDPGSRAGGRHGATARRTRITSRSRSRTSTPRVRLAAGALRSRGRTARLSVGALRVPPRPRRPARRAGQSL